MSMNPEVKAKWLESLRSGNYAQGRKCLRMGDNFCCLGVLTDVYVKETNKMWEYPFGPVKAYFGGCAGLTPPRVSEWAGFDPHKFAVGDGDPVLPFTDREGNIVALSILNDHGFTFSKLSDLIEAFL